MPAPAWSAAVKPARGPALPGARPGGALKGPLKLGLPGIEPPAAIAGGPAPATALPGARAGAPLPSAAGPDPKDPGFEEKAWSDAQRHGLVREAEEPPSVPDSSGASTLERSQAPAEKAPAKAVPPPRSVLAPRVLGFFSAFALVQVTVESLALAVPQMTDPLTQGFLALGAVSALSYVAYAAGAIVGGRWLERVGIGRAYRLVLTTRALLWTAAAALFDPVAQTIPIAALTVIFALDYFAHSINRVAEHTLQVAWFKDAPATSARFGAMRDFVEYFTVFAVLGAGMLIAAYGFGSIVYATPVLFGAAAATSFFLRGLPAAAVEKVQLSVVEGFRELFATADRARLFLGQTLINGFLYLLYYVTATAFALHASGGDKGQTALVASALMSVYGAGALLATFVMGWVSKRVEARTSGVPETEKAAAQARALAGTARPALLLAAAALAIGSWTFTMFAPLGTLIWPVYAVLPALAVIGLTAQVALNHLDTLLKAQLPRQSAANVLGSARALMNLSYAAAFVLWGFLFDAFSRDAFYLLALSSMAAALAYVWLASRIGK